MSKTRGLDVRVVKSGRDAIKKTAHQKNFTLPPPGLLSIIGSTGSGKTVLICNLLEKRLLGSAFDLIYVFCMSPCTMIMDDCKKVKKSRVFTDGDPEKLVEIISAQKSFIEKYKFKKAPHILVLLDDMVQDRKFFRHPAMRELAFAGTHMKISTWITSQSYVEIPRAIRINCHSLILFHGMKESEYTRFVDEYQSPYMSKNDFIAMVKYALADPYSFMFVNCTHPNKRLAFRKGWDTILEIK